MSLWTLVLQGMRKKRHLSLLVTLHKENHSKIKTESKAKLGGPHKTKSTNAGLVETERPKSGRPTASALRPIRFLVCWWTYIVIIIFWQCQQVGKDSYILHKFF